MAMNKTEKKRAQSLLVSMLANTEAALLRLQEEKPDIFRRSVARTIYDGDAVKLVVRELNHALAFFRREKEVNWDSIEQVGLGGRMLEWKADLFYQALGKPKPKENQPEEILTYPQSRTVWSRLFKYLKSLFGSLIEAVEKDSRIRMTLDFIKEFVECLDASVRFIQGGQEEAG